MSTISKHTPQILLSSRVYRNDTVFCANVGQDLVVYDHDAGKYYGSGPVGDAIWTLIEKDTLVSAVCNQLLEDFEIDRPTCEAEVLDYLRQLHQSKLLNVA